MNTKKILKLRNHWRYTAIGESHRESSVITNDTSVALNAALKSERRIIILKNALVEIVNEVEELLSCKALKNNCLLAKKLGHFKTVLEGRK
jgi:hypothetical protein